MAKSFAISLAFEAVDKVTKVVDKVVHNTTHSMHRLEEAGERLHGKLERAFKLPGGHALGFAAELATVAGLTEVYEKCTEASEEQTSATAHLTALMRNVKGATSGFTKEVIENAEALERSTGINHKVAMGLDAQLALYRATPELIKKATPVLLGLVEAQTGHIATLEKSTQIGMRFGRVLNNQAPALTRFGIETDKNTRKLWKNWSAYERGDFVLRKILPRIKGVMAALAKTPEGQRGILGGQIEHLQEQVGLPLLALNRSMLQLAIVALPLVIPLVDKLAVGLTKLTGTIKYYVQQLAVWSKRNPEAARAVSDLAAAVSGKFVSVFITAAGLIAGLVVHVATWAKANPKLAKILGDLALWAIAFVVLLGPMLKVLPVIIQVVGWVGKFGKWVGVAVQWLMKLGPWIAEVTELIGAYGLSIESLVAIFPALGAAIAALSGPVGWVILAVVAVAAVAIAVWKNWDKVKKTFQAFFKFLMGDSPLAKIIRAINPLWNITYLIIKNWEKLKTWFKNFKTWFAQLWADIVKSPEFQLLSKVLGGIGQFAAKGAGDIWKYLTTDPNDAARPAAPRAMPGGVAPVYTAPPLPGSSTVHVDFRNVPKGTRVRSHLAPGHTVSMGWTNHSFDGST